MRQPKPTPLWRREIVLRLRELQTRFASCLVDANTDSVLGLIEVEEFSASERIQIYRNNLFISLTNALQAIYPSIRRLVGEGFFKYLANSYIRAHPSQSGNLHDFGQELAPFIARFEPAATVPYLADVAQLEWAQHEVFHAAEHPPLDLQRLSAVPDELRTELRFCFHPASKLIASPYPVLKIWEACRDEHETSDIISADDEGEQILVVRQQEKIELHRLRDAEYTFLKALEDGYRLGTAYERGAEVDKRFDLATSLQKHIAQSTLVAWHIT
jgi:hypothetical protein